MNSISLNIQFSSSNKLFGIDFKKLQDAQRMYGVNLKGYYIEKQKRMNEKNLKQKIDSMKQTLAQNNMSSS